MPVAGAVHPLLHLEGDDRFGDETAIPLVERVRRRSKPAVRLRELRVAVQRSWLRDWQVDLGRGGPLVAEKRLDVPDRTRDLWDDGVAVLGVVDREAEDVAKLHRPVV